MTDSPVAALIATWRIESADATEAYRKHGDQHLTGEAEALARCADELEAALTARGWQTFNINSHVRVKVTEHGFAVMDAADEALNRLLGSRLPHRSPRIRVEQAEGNGWSRWQMWDLMQTFGSAVGMGRDVPFETAVEFELPSAPTETKT